MKTTITVIAGLVATATSIAIPRITKRDSISVTPHDEYSSSVGVLGCKINVNRVAYFPSFPSCDSMCVKVSANGRSVNLLHVDSSGGAYDMSYDAWNYLNTGESATQDPTEGGGIPATYETLDMSECSDLITTPNGKLAFSAANSIDFVTSCPASSWVGENYALYNIATPTCTLGLDQVCTLDLSISNQPSCPGLLGSQAPLNEAITNIVYGTGAQEKATQ